ncbi:PREDICTED: uncharacterized protein LOC108366854 [Rhagoletis zephyria]|uniref:uncharacterized protein LOC108366854 n=1 Tax=Rhagoletis zephyria TaxID=28612 RepID=UPI0008116004|nr:PREDICTED: uncharacterized protein LOC108366854 [Rhagoletis zephyria]
MLGLRSAFKPDIGTTAAQLVYDTTLRIPEEFFDECRPQPQSEFAKQLAEVMQDIRPPLTANHYKTKPFVFKQLADATHVFVRNDKIRAVLQPPYDGPYLVVSRQNKHFTVQINRDKIKISIDRLKPAFIEYDNIDDPPQRTTQPSKPAQESTTNTITPSQRHLATSTQPILPQDTPTTRHGRKIRLPVRFRT